MYYRSLVINVFSFEYYVFGYFICWVVMYFGYCILCYCMRIVSMYLGIFRFYPILWILFDILSNHFLSSDAKEEEILDYKIECYYFFDR